MSKNLALALLSGCLATMAWAQAPPSPPTGQEQPARLAPNVIEKVEIQGLRHIQQDKLRVRLKAKPGDVVNEMVLARDLITLQDTGDFLEVNMFKQPGERGGTVVRFVVLERNAPKTPPPPPPRPNSQQH